jgi:cytoskeleton protein RodZ
MTDDKDKPDAETPDTEAEGLVGGERLAEARRAKKISVLEIAKELHVEEAKIRALENNEFDELGAPVFAKGHLKKYSQLVGVNHDDVLADYYRLTRSQEMPPVIVKRQQAKRELSPGPWIAVIALLLVLALAYWLLVERPFAPTPAPAVTTPAATESTPPPETARIEVEEPPAGDSPPSDAPSGDAPAEEIALPETPTGDSSTAEVVAQPPADEPDAASTVAEQPTQPVTASISTTAAADDDVRLSVTFLGDCWTEITDASGRRLFFQLGRSGRTVNVSGPGPLSVLFGDAGNVDVRVNGEDFTIPAAGRRGRTARLTISGP